MLRYVQRIRLISIALLAATICAIIAGVDSTPGNSNINTGYSLRRASAIIFLFCVLAAILIAYSLFARARTREQKYDLVLFQTIIVLPIMLMRIIYAVIQSFLSTPTNPGRNTWVYLCLLLIPDLVSLTIYTVCGFMISKAPAGVTDYYHQRNVEDGKAGVADPGNVQESTSGQVEYDTQASTNIRTRRRRRPRGPIGLLIVTIIDLFRKDNK